MIERSASLPYSNTSIVEPPAPLATAIWPMRGRIDARRP